MIRAFIVDDHEIVRHGIRSSLNNTPDIRVVGEAGTIARALRWVNTGIDVIVLDIILPDGKGSDYIDQIREANADVRIIALTGLASTELFVKIISAGVDGIVLKDSPVKDLANAIRVVFEGEPYIDPMVARVLSKTLMRQELTDRELEIMKELAEGKRISEIASTKYIGERTVKADIESVRMKLGVETTNQALVFLTKQGKL